MTPNARIAAAIAVLDQVLDGTPAEQALLRWSRGARYAGSGDRAAVRDLVFDSLRRLRSRAQLGGARSGRGLMLGMCREAGQDPAAVFTGQGHDPAALTPEELTTPADLSDIAALDLPDWLIPEWQAALGDRAGAVAAAMRQRAPVWLRVNAAKTDAAEAIAALAGDGIIAQADADMPTALRVQQGERRIAASAAYRDGLVELQDLSPQIACAMLPLSPGDRVLDYCAGGGGKALAMAARGAGAITAHDANPDRLGDLPARAARAGANIRVAGRPGGSFDLVIADVPCSGSGTWRRSPDMKWRLTPQSLLDLQRVQAQILDQAAALTAPGGHLAYMTCSVLGGENQHQIDAFLQRHPQYHLTASRVMTPLAESDGFFVAVLQNPAAGVGN